jgi:hypothetical protein
MGGVRAANGYATATAGRVKGQTPRAIDLTH